MFKRSKLTSKKFEKRKKIFFWIKIWSIFFCFALIIVSLYFLFRLKDITINTISVMGNTATSGDEIIALVEDELQGSYYWLFPKKNALIYPKNTIEEKIKDKWKRIGTLSISRSSLTSLKVEVVEKKAKFLWCGKVLSVSSSADSCYFIDESGYIFGKAPTFSDNVYLRLFGNVETPDPVGQNYLPISDFQHLSNFVQDLEKLKIQPSRLYAKGAGEYELYLDSQSRILFNDRQDFAKTYGNLETLLDSDAYKGDVKKASSSLDYIDVRFGNKVFYKFK